MKYLHIIILFFMQAFSLLSFSQTDNLKFSHLTTSDGLSQSSVFAILKDYKGFRWFATDEGLNKYDGYKFTVSSVKDNDFVPPVYFTDFQVFNKPVGIGGNFPLKQSIKPHSGLHGGLCWQYSS